MKNKTCNQTIDPIKVIRLMMMNFPEYSSPSLRCTDWHYWKLNFTFQDVEEEKEHKLGKEQLLKAFSLMVDGGKWPSGPCGCTPLPVERTKEAWEDWLCQFDAGDADAFIQLAIFGEVIYG